MIDGGAGPLIDSWLKLASHSRPTWVWDGRERHVASPGCDQCEATFVRMLVSDRPELLYGGLCESGQSAFDGWWADKEAWSASSELGALRDRLGFAGLSEELADERAAALVQVPGDAFRRLSTLEPEARHAQITAIVAAYRRRPDPPQPPLTTPPTPTSYRCAAAGCSRIFTPRRPSDRYCSATCRMAANDARRPVLVPSESDE